MTTHLEDYLSNPNDNNKELALIELAGLFNRAYADAVTVLDGKIVGTEDCSDQVVVRIRDKYDELITRMSKGQLVNLENLCADLHGCDAFKAIPAEFEHVSQCGSLSMPAIYIYGDAKRLQDEVAGIIQEKDPKIDYQAKGGAKRSLVADQGLTNESHFVRCAWFMPAYIRVRQNKFSREDAVEYLLGQRSVYSPEKLAQAVIKMGCVGQKTYAFLESHPQLFEEIVETEQKLSKLYQMTQSYQEFCKEKLWALPDKTTKKGLHLKDKIDVLDDIKKIITDPKKHTAEEIDALNDVSNSKESNKLNEDSAGLGILHFIRNFLPFFKRFLRTKGQEVQSGLESTLKRKNTVTLFKDVLDQQAKRALDLEEDILVDPPTLAVMALNA
ncbi:hypothetical protein Psal071_00654 [Piscirickettsia salmonis]|uniref:Uncharacterized protein n=1 Tax=Piscirickettsia salmonis TaxID=1238 RepID=A0A9Q6LJ16_PISSA|nr:hypothetical protein [Piscirickettsia salmonis]QGN94085.1 hypothetical protein Psal006a_00657 [Piscirickettsia salmonis]QGO05028.1 hypothetical protein Psal009_00908 [Piscirickettsia salmonis]QGO33349.1 hypothetical protein Psal028_00655 [Piscirickettsia salmonis]QGO36961.1 hypothetical protein Psal040_00655 [Piscirickettsia salmonis]QGO40585.1 hypothetical protein Psal041_00654 [Piscirickettsia salmonis]